MTDVRVARWTEAERTFGEIRELVETAVQAKLGELAPGQYLWVQDLAEGWVVYDIDGAGTVTPGTFRASYSIDDNGAVTLGDPEKVEERKQYQTVTESRDQLDGRVLEAKADGEDGGRIFRVQILQYGVSRNGKRYTESVMRRAVPRYEGAKAFDHHRTMDELRTSTIDGLVGSYRNVEATNFGLFGDLHLLPSATHTAEALDASLDAQKENLPPVVGISHDVVAGFRPVVDTGGRAVQEATEILSVNSADVVADPSAGGRVERMVAGGTDDPNPEGTSMKTLKQLLAALKADPAKRADLLTEYAEVLEAQGLAESDIDLLLAEPAETGETKPEGETKPPAAEAKPEGELVGAGAGQKATEAATFDKTSLIGKRLVQDALDAAQLPELAREAVVKSLPDLFSEGELVRQVESVQGMRSELEKAGLTPTVGTVTKDQADRHTEALDAFFEGDFDKGFRSFKEAYVVFTGDQPYGLGNSEDFNRRVLRECIGNPLAMYDSSVARSTESMTTSTFAEALGDSITRRMVKEYLRPALDAWKAVVSDTPPINDFRTQRIDRLGGYGTLPTVGEGAPYQPLTSPGDEEATYAIAKKGGTDDITLETIANDDVRLITRIPSRLGLAAAHTLQAFVWAFLTSNATCTYDSVALFHASHANTTAVPLSNANLAAVRAKMRQQAAYGDTSDILSLVPKTLIVPPQLEDLGNQLTQGGRAVPATTPGASDVPNLHQGMNLAVVDMFTDADDWFVAADPSAVPMIEVGFYQGRQTPELFAQTDPLVGSVFNADKITYKIRHIYGGTVVDHRGLQRGTQ